MSVFLSLISLFPKGAQMHGAPSFMPELLAFLSQIALYAPPLLFSITCHEVAHGYVANRLGDQTAKLAGRLTLNPLKHLDLVGTLALVITRMFGWAKPVPINPSNFKKPRQGLLLVSLAGPAANFILACLFALGYHGLQAAAPRVPEGLINTLIVPLVFMSWIGAKVNLALGLFNLLPIPPLDGGGIIVNLLPFRLAYKFERIGPYGFIIIILLIMTNALQYLIGPPMYALSALLRLQLIP